MLCASAAAALSGCTGQIIDPGGGPKSGNPGSEGPSGETPPPSGEVPPGVSPGAPGQMVVPGPPLRSAGTSRLTRQELSRSIKRLLGADAPVDVTLLPEDTLTPFDNDVQEQSPSMLLAEGVEAIAGDVATWAVATPARLQTIVPCTPASAADADCFGKFLQGFGRRVLRRPLDMDETRSMTEVLSYAQSSGRFADAVAVALRIFLQHPEFLYRVEPGVPTSGNQIRLTAWETATRLSFLLQGMTPDDGLLNAAAAGELDSAAGRLHQAQRLLAAEEGKQQLRRFHALWLGYSRLQSLPLADQLRTETDALVDRATEAGRDYRYLLMADETRAAAELASQYGLPASPDASGWVSYQGSPRRGILSHGMFAAAGAKFSDTSPTRRGKFIRERFLCDPVQLPPPSVNVDVDLPPQSKTPGACKIQRYAEHRDNPACAGCHARMDPIGFGLENFDEVGRYRDHDKDRPECPIDGVGQLDEATTFHGAKELAGLIAQSPRLSACVGEYFMRFAAGRQLDDDDRPRARWLGVELEENGNSFVEMVLAYVSHENFRYREE